MARLRRADCSGPGFRRVKRGRGFSYLDEDGDPIDEPEVVERLRGLGIPPAWREVWICPWANGHIQATGLDAAGRNRLPALFRRSFGRYAPPGRPYGGDRRNRIQRPGASNQGHDGDQGGPALRHD